ncbi:hypothetical protein DL770_005035 [Monosporascus sp. CRB-9-2]|nr:hypothetical protein DL770_005035 [Monosporascus sp. CRB-9-2]
MTYRGSMPSGRGSGFDGQQSYSHPHSHPSVQTQAVHNGYDQYGNPQYRQYQNAMFMSTAFPPPPPPQQQQQQRQLPLPHTPHHQTMQTPQGLSYHQAIPHTHTQAHGHATQFQTYEPSFDKRPFQPVPPNNTSGQMISQQQQFMQQPMPQQHQQHQHQQQHQQRQQNHHHQQHQYAQQMGWHQMLPPMSAPTSTSSYQQHPSLPSPSPQAQFVHQQQYQQPSQRTNSPITSHSSQVPSQHAPSTNTNNSRIVSASANGSIQKARRVSASPQLTSQGIARSSSVSSTRSSAATPGLIPHHKDTNALLICVAEELLAKARNDASTVASSGDVKQLQEYQKIVATGLGCLEVVLSSNKLPPRLEARLQLRYANILSEETTNVMEAETTLTKGITLCERNRFADLKYMMQFLQVKMLSQRRGKAALIAVDGRIKDAEVLKHAHWVYAFRFLKASLYLESPNPSEAPALENLKAIANLASQRGDHAVFVVASLLEGLSLLKTMKDDAVVRIQSCIAQASKYQLEDSVHILQLDILALMLDLACSLYQKSPQVVTQKVRVLQSRLDTCLNSEEWGLASTELFLPIHKQSSNHKVISGDTASILRPGQEHEPCDYLVMSFWSKVEAFTVTYTYSGLGLLYQHPRNDKRMFELWGEALSQLKKNADRIRGLPTSLQDAMKCASWRREVKCYLEILRGLHFATSNQWAEVKKCVEQLEMIVKPSLKGILGVYSLYLSGVYHQGTQDFDTAEEIYSHPSLSLEAYDAGQGSRKQAELEVSLLAAFNRIWIMQHPAHQNNKVTLDLLDQLRLLCPDHPNREIRTIYHLVLAAAKTVPPVPMTTVKTHISTALNSAKALGDIQTSSIALSLMRAKLFQNIVGEQALQCARAASQQARRSGNLIWMSVADNMLAQSLDVQGHTAEAQNVAQAAINHAVLAGRNGDYTR